MTLCFCLSKYHSLKKIRLLICCLSTEFCRLAKKKCKMVFNANFCNLNIFSLKK